MSLFKNLGFSRFFKKDINENKEIRKANYDSIGINYISTFYKNDETNIQFIRIVNDNIKLRKIEGTINFDSFYNTNQTISSNETLKEFEKEEFEMSILNQGYRVNFREQKDEVLFLQLQPTIGSEIEALNIRQQVEVN